MIGDLKPYPGYRESEMPWVGRMPSHWSQRRMKFLFAERAQKGFPDEPLLAATQTKGVVRKEDYGTRTVTATKDFHLLKLVETGDFVVSLRSFEGGLEIAHCRGIISPAYTVLRPSSDAQPGYYSRFFKSRDFISGLTLFVTGIREGQNIDYARLSRAYMPLPPAEDQLAIGRFLDWANGRLERAIRAKRKVIALLNEQKQSIIHCAVTRGLDPSVPIKPSGIPWLGNVPQHWEVLALKRVLRRLIDCEHKTAPVVDDSDLRVVRTTAIKRGKLFMRGTYGTSLEAFSQWTRRGIPTEGDVLFTREAPAGECCVMPKGLRACLGQRTVLMKLRPERLDPDFLVHSIYSGPPRIAIVHASQGSTVSHFNMSDIGSLPIFLPPLAEQKELVERIAHETSPLDNTIERLEREIDLLREYRTRLIVDVVTGKLDVSKIELPESSDRLSGLPIDAIDTDGTEDALETEEQTSYEIEA
jgi:type I restriction enzyme S subunit